MRGEPRISEAEHEWRSCTRKIRHPSIESARETCADIYAATLGKKWPAGCQNDGSGCICECHDPAPAVSEEER